MLTRYKTFDSTGIALAGRLYAGDLNGIQDAAAAQSDFAQTIDLANLRIGDSAIQLSKFGTNEAQFSGHLRSLGILRGLGGLISGAFTTTQRDAIASGFAPYGIVILNTTTNQYEWNRGTDAARDWRPFGVDTGLSITFTGGLSAIHFTNQTALNTIIDSLRGGDTVTRLMIREDGRIELGPGNAARDAMIYRDAANRIRIDNDLNLGGNTILFGAGGSSLFVDGVASRIRGNTLSIQNADGSIELGFIGDNIYRFRDGRYGVRAVAQKLMIQTGTYTTVTSGGGAGDTVTFPVAFTAKPAVFQTPINATAEAAAGQPKSVGLTSFIVSSFNVGSQFQWLAIGPI